MGDVVAGAQLWHPHGRVRGPLAQDRWPVRRRASSDVPRHRAVPSRRVAGAPESAASRCDRALRRALHAGPYRRGGESPARRLRRALSPIRRARPSTRTLRRVKGSRAAIAEGWPVFVTAIVVGITFGLTARQSGLGILETSAMSVIVFAGAAQFVMVDLLRTGTPVPLIVITVLLLNARHLLMAAAIRPFVVTASLPRRFGLAYVLTDEAFAMGICWFRRGHREGFVGQDMRE